MDGFNVQNTALFRQKHYISSKSHFLRPIFYFLRNPMDHLKSVCPALEAFYGPSDWRRVHWWKRLQKCKTCCRLTQRQAAGRSESVSVNRSKVHSDHTRHDSAHGGTRTLGAKRTARTSGKRRFSARRATGSGRRMLCSSSVVVECG